MNQFSASLRRVFASLAMVALISGLTPALLGAQTDPKPAEPPAPEQPAAPDTTANSAPAPAPDTTAKVVPAAMADTTAKVVPAAMADTTAKNTPASKAGKAAKTPRPAKASRARKAAASDSTSATSGAAAKAERPAKAPKTRAPEPSLEEQKKADGVYAKGSNWMSFRFGYAKRAGDLTGDGLVGYGAGFQHMISKRYAFAAGVGHDIVGHFGKQIDEAVPFTGEFQRYFHWKTVVRPYVGLGGGFYLRKSYRTDSDYTTTTTGGPHFSLGFTSALDANHVIGFETRAAQLSGRPGVVNPTFGPGKDSETIWTAKVSWALVY